MALKKIQEKELELWRDWRAGDKNALGKLYKSFRPVENSWYSKLGAQNLP